ncbi:MAG: acyl-CoA dehydrogenase, partial [Gammaproteobacteria bacterium]
MAYHRLPLWSWAVVIISSGWSIWWFVYPNIFILITMIALTAGLTMLIALPVRRTIVTRPAFGIFRKKVPVMSETERQALEAGDTWWDGELFTGKPNWKSLLDTPAPQLTQEEKAFLDGPTEKLCQMVDDWQITHHERRLPDNVWNFMRNQRFFGMIIPKKYGGLEFSALAHSNVVMKLASRSVSAAVTVMVPNSLGPAELLLSYGTEEQKNYYLPRLAIGKEIPCF